MPKNKTITCDIDGVLNFYPQTFIDYAQNEYNTAINDLSNYKSQYFEKYTEIKSAYRYSSYKHEAIARSLVVDELNALASRGYDIHILTTRPFDRFPGMYELTFKWLESIDLNFSSLQSKTKSKIDVISPLFHLDDELDHILEIYNSNTSFFLFQDLSEVQIITSHNNVTSVTEHTLSNEIERLIND